ncbi:MAG: HD domain-containing protein, partial [Treponema sp.]|nr:HD domain-containing protein [Treponema sp.]
FVLQLVVFLYSFDHNMDITVMYMMAPLAALLYVNPKLEIITCIISIVSMMAGIVIQAPVTVQAFFPDLTPQFFIITTGGAHLVEMLVASVFFIMITILFRRLMFAYKKQDDEIHSIQNNLAYSFADMIESRDGTTGEHVKRTSKVVSLIVEKIKNNPELYPNTFRERELDLIAMSAPLHDIGKLKVPDSILSKPGKLTDDEFNIIKTHSAEGAKIIDKTMTNIEDSFYVNIAHDMALYHHEKWSGKGYPKGISGEDIPVCARIMAVADVFDALCSKRSYKNAFTIDEAYEIMNDSKETHFEPALVDILNDLKDEMIEIYVTPEEKVSV